MKITKFAIRAKISGGISLAFLLVHSVAAAPVLLASYPLNGDGNDATGNCPPMELFNTSFVSNTLFMPVEPTNWHGACARITGFSYDSFTVAVDFKPTSAAPTWGEAILYGGPACRWLGFDRVEDHLRITLNNHNLVFDFPDAHLASNQWHRLACSFDLAGQRIVTVLDGVRLADIELHNFQFEVVGTEYELWEKVFCFENYGNASTFQGFADNLKLYNPALMPAEITALFFPRVNCVRSGTMLLLHWPVADMDGFILESTPAFSTTNLWTPVTPAPVVIGNQFVVPQEIAGPSRFFRLRK